MELVNKLCSFLCNMLKSWEHVIEVVNKLCSYQRTPLFSAASSGNVDAVRHLVDKDADVNIKDDYGVSKWDCCWLLVSVGVLGRGVVFHTAAPGYMEYLHAYTLRLIVVAKQSGENGISCEYWLCYVTWSKILVVVNVKPFDSLSISLIRGLPSIGQLRVATLTQWDTLLRKELMSTSKHTLG